MPSKAITFLRNMNFTDEDIINFSREIIENLKADYEIKKVIEDKKAA